MIRFVCLNAFVAVYTLLFCFWGFMVSIFDKDGRLVHFYVAVPWAKVVLWVCGIKVIVRGKENVDSTLPRIYMTNHQSYFDIFALLAHLPVDFKFIVKQELMRIPVFGHAMRKAGYIGIERKDPRKGVKSMREAADRIKKGASVVMFPEGTRSSDGKLLPFKRGGFNLALRSGCEIVPIGIKGSYRIVPKGSLRINKGSFEMGIGKPISIGGYKKKEMEQMIDKVREAIKEQLGEAL